MHSRPSPKAFFPTVLISSGSFLAQACRPALEGSMVELSNGIADQIGKVAYLEVA